MQLPSSTVGKQGKCPGCGEVVTIRSGPTDDDEFLAMAFGTGDDVSDEEPMLLHLTSSSPVTNTGNSHTNNCSDCGGMVSVQVSTCPHCGAPTFLSGSTASVPSFTGDQSLPRQPEYRRATGQDIKTRRTLLLSIAVCFLVVGLFFVPRYIANRSKVKKLWDEWDTIMREHDAVGDGLADAARTNPTNTNLDIKWLKLKIEAQDILTEIVRIDLDAKFPNDNRRGRKGSVKKYVLMKEAEVSKIRVIINSGKY